jgi:hypothetical protein
MSKQKRKRIHVVQETHDNKKVTIRLVRSLGPNKALEHVTAGRFTVAEADQEDIVNAMNLGVKVEDAAE